MFYLESCLLVFLWSCQFNMEVDADWLKPASSGHIDLEVAAWFTLTGMTACSVQWPPRWCSYNGCHLGYIAIATSLSIAVCRSDEMGQVHRGVKLGFSRGGLNLMQDKEECYERGNIILRQWQLFHSVLNSLPRYTTTTPVLPLDPSLAHSVSELPVLGNIMNFLCSKCNNAWCEADQLQKFEKLFLLFMQIVLNVQLLCVRYRVIPILTHPLSNNHRYWGWKIIHIAELVDEFFLTNLVLTGPEWRLQRAIVCISPRLLCCSCFFLCNSSNGVIESSVHCKISRAKSSDMISSAKYLLSVALSFGDNCLVLMYDRSFCMN